MDADLMRTCEMFIRNRDLLSDTFRWDGSAMHLIGAAILTEHETEPEIETLKQCASIIKENASMLSPLRGHLRIILICSMMMSDDPEEYYNNVQRAYNLIRITRKKRDERFYLSALSMCNTISDKEELLGEVDRANEICAELKNLPGFAQDERGFVDAGIISSAGVTDVQTFASEAAKCVAALEDTFGRSSDLAELACILALDKNSAGFKCGRLKEIYRMLDSEGIRYGRGDVLSVLGSLTMLDMTNSEIAGAMKEADAYLRSQKGFGMYGSGPEKRHMYAALMVMCAYASALNAGRMASASVIEGAVSSQFAAMAASTMMMSSAVYEALDAGLPIY